MLGDLFAQDDSELYTDGGGGSNAACPRVLLFNRLLLGMLLTFATHVPLR
jgi:hypothetical protein